MRVSAWMYGLAGMFFACGRAASTSAPPQVQASQAPASSDERTFAGRGFSLRLSLAPLPNLLYHLDCVSGAVFCSPNGFRKLWSELGLAAEDEAALARWKNVRTQRTGSIRADAETANAPLLLPGAFIDLTERQRLAALRARTLDELESTLALLTSDADAHELRAIAEHFEPRFTQYWQNTGHAAGAAYLADLARLLGDQFLLDTLARVARFEDHAATQRSHEYRLHVIVQPGAAKQSFNAYQIESDFLVESSEQGSALDVIDVVAHELCHALLYQMPADSKRVLVDAFLQSSDVYSLVDYGLFDEALATAIGNGLVWKHFHPNENFEQHRARNFHSKYTAAASLAVALEPKLDALLAGDTKLASASFVSTLGEAARASYRAHGPMPIDYLHSPILISTSALEPAAAKLRDTAFASFPYLREFKQLDAEAKYYLQQHPQLSAAVFVPSTAPLPELLTALGMDPHRSAELQELVTRDRGLVYAMRLTSKAYMFIFVASDATSANQLTDAFIALHEMRDGALIELPR